MIRRRAWVSQVLLGTALVCGLVALATAVYLATGQNRRATDDHLRSHLARAIGEFRAVLGEVAARHALGLGDAGIGQPPTELGRRLAPVGSQRYRHRWAYLVGFDGRPLASYPEAESSIPAGIVPVVEDFRTQVRQRVAYNRYRDGKPDALVRSEIVRVHDHPAIATLVPVRGGATRSLDPHTSMMLVTVTPIDGPVLDALADATGISGLRFAETPPQAPSPLYPQTDQRGRIVGWYAWDSIPDAGHSSWPWILSALGGIAVLGFAGMSLYQIRRTGQGLEETNREIRHIAQHDPLTGLPNRRKVITLFGQILRGHVAEVGVMFACIDLDCFKEINEVMGHDVGDRLIVEAAERLQEAMPAGAVLGRMDGDEFALIAAVGDHASAVEIAQACTAAIAVPFVIRDQVINITASIGFVLAPRDGDSARELIRRSDLAVRAAKKGGRGRVLAFHHGLEDEINERRFIEQELRFALDEGKLSVFYQPIVAGDGLRIVGAEALVRWTHPARGSIPPSVFVAVAEQAGMMIQLGKFVLRQALADAAEWPNLYIAINLSPIQMRDRGLLHSVADAISDSGIDPSRVVLEITEGVLIDNPEEAKQRLKELRALGVRIALDDFGSGYSSLSYLRRLPIDKLKIDKEFVAPLGRSANGGVIMQAIVALGRALGLSVLAEGVETEEQRLLLRLAGCDELQGFLFARPMPAEAFVKYITMRKAGAAIAIEEDVAPTMAAEI